MQIKGTVKNIIFRSDDTGFTVLELVDDQGDEITAVGPMLAAAVGERIEVTGDWNEHRSYGMQFKATGCVTLAPATIGALTAYLSCGLIKGIGPETAKNIVATFGMDTISVMENQPERLTEVYGIGRVRAAAIAASYMAQKDMRDVMIGLQEYGITVNQAMKLYKIYGPHCLERLKENPYRLIDDVEGIGFRTADKIALSGGFEPDSPFRLRAGLRYTLQWACREGHTYLPREKLIQVAADILGSDPGPVERELDELIIGESVVYKAVNNTDACFLPYLYRMESECAARLNLLAAPREKTLPYFNIESQTEKLETKYKLSLAAEQKRAVRLALTSGALVITGGPGTGKTTIIKCIIKLLSVHGDIALAAPTGRAAKRMSEACGMEAKTLHRPLEYGGEEGDFARTQDNPLEYDALIIDEMSMVDIFLMRSLLRALVPGTRLIMVGDADQLPSVGAGNVLRDILDSGAIPSVLLTEIFRQDEKSMIVYNAHRINRGEAPRLNAKGSDFFFERAVSPSDAAKRIVALCASRLPSFLHLDPVRQMQVLSPTKKGECGVWMLNQLLQAEFNPAAPGKHERVRGDTTFREGDKVMQTRNNYQLKWQKEGVFGAEEGQGVFNGDIGFIVSIDPQEHVMSVQFDDERVAEYEGADVDDLELAYCISVHKSQGSEFPVVVMPAVGGPPMLLTRNLFYTAVTRARRIVMIVGRESAIDQMIANVNTRRRYSALCWRLQQGMSL